MKNLTRNRVEGCVMARIMRAGVRHQQNFGLSKFKTWEAAEREAAAWLNNIRKTLPDEAPRLERMTASNHSGVVNVFLQRHIVSKPTHDLEYWRWIARWKGCALKGGVAWYINELRDDEDAFVLAYLTHEMRTTDRSEVEEQFQVIAGTKKQKEILALKHDSPDFH